MHPRVSVVIPTYYRNDYLDRCLKSVQNQSYENIELIVVDDSGEQHAEPVVAKYSAQYISLEKNQGPSYARNMGLEAASGEYIQLLDDDDKLEPDKIQKQVSLLEKTSNSELAYCGYKNKSGEITAPRQVDDHLKQCLMFRLPACVTSTMLVSADLMSQIFPLPETPGSDDTFWKIEFAKRTTFVSISDPLVIKGEPEDQRMYSEGAVDGASAVIQQYEDLYHKYDNNVLKKAIAQKERFEALHILQTNSWSSRAIYLCVHALYVDSKLTRWGLFLAISSVFGNTGISVGRRLAKQLNIQ